MMKKKIIENREEDLSRNNFAIDSTIKFDVNNVPDNYLNIVEQLGTMSLQEWQKM